MLDLCSAEIKVRMYFLLFETLFFFYLHKTNIEYTEHNSSFDYLGVRNILDPDVSEISSQKGLAGLRLL